MSKNLIGFYDVVIDQDMLFSHIRYPVSEECKYTLSLKFEPGGKYSVYFNYNDDVRMREWNDDFITMDSWTFKEDTLVIHRKDQLKLIFINELNSFVTPDLKLLLKKAK